MNKAEQWLKANDAWRFDYAITRSMSGKMEGMSSISTSPLINPACVARHNNNPESICKDCFSCRQNEHQKNLREKLERNTLFLTEKVYPADVLPAIYSQLFRFEAFGDIMPGQAGKNQLHNYRNLVLRNPSVKAALWTKNHGFVNRFFRERGKPENLQLIGSIEKVNPTREEVAAMMKRYPIFDKWFIVVTKKYAGHVNCAKQCFGCGWCYTGTGSKVIIELKK